MASFAPYSASTTASTCTTWAYRDQLVLTGRLNDVGEYIRTNVPDTYRLGVELQGGVQLTDYFTLGGNLTLSRNRVRAFYRNPSTTSTPPSTTRARRSYRRRTPR